MLLGIIARPYRLNMALNNRQGGEMEENEIPGPMTMVKIDGAKIKRLREQQGLTQLYLATAVQVTTDTISRWENRRYPSIKKENGLKLAEALNAELEDLLEDEEVPPSASTSEQAETPEGPGHHPSRRHFLLKIWPIVLLTVFLLTVFLVFLWYWREAKPTPAFSARRILPAHCIAGQPFPVIVKITGDPDRSATIIIKENLPDTATLLSASPNITSGGVKNKEIKWLKKIKGNSVFAYVLSVRGTIGTPITFSGTISVGGKSTVTSSIEGADTILISKYHWADSNKDNIISDKEILTVYDRYSEITGLDLDLDKIEKIWLGSGYTWDAANKTFKIKK
jgi:transcriptional regulator with XRE-family HTH domain